MNLKLCPFFEISYLLTLEYVMTLSLHHPLGGTNMKFIDAIESFTRLISLVSLASESHKHLTEAGMDEEVAIQKSLRAKSE